MQQGMIQCNGVQTQVITAGRWVEEEAPSHGSKNVVLIIPGNPGIPEFYKEFIAVVNSKLPENTPTWVVGHAGHVQPPKDLSIALPDNSFWRQHYGLQGQLEHKKDFINKYVPKDANLYLIAHSIGSWMTLNLLRDESIAKRVKKCYLLFPTIENMATTPNGRFFTNYVAHVSKILLYLAIMFTFLPVFIQEFLVRVFGIFYGIPGKHTKAVLQLIHPEVLKKVFGLGREEMKKVTELDDELISKNADKLWLYYGTTDGWTPKKYYENMIAKHPNVEAQLCKRGFRHAFVLKDAKDMGNIVGDLINESISKA